MASRHNVQHSRASERLVSVEAALEMIHTQGSDVEEDINDSSDENSDPCNVDTDTEVGDFLACHLCWSVQALVGP